MRKVCFLFVGFGCNSHYSEPNSFRNYSSVNISLERIQRSLFKLKPGLLPNSNNAFLSTRIPFREKFRYRLFHIAVLKIFNDVHNEYGCVHNRKLLCFVLSCISYFTFRILNNLYLRCASTRLCTRPDSRELCIQSIHRRLLRCHPDSYSSRAAGAKLGQL